MGVDGTVKNPCDGMLQTPGMLMGLVVLWREGDDRAAKSIEPQRHKGHGDQRRKRRNLGCPGFVSLLVDFELASVVAFFAVVARVSFCDSHPKAVVQFGLKATKRFSEQTAFHEAHEKGLATLATTATASATESPRQQDAIITVRLNLFKNRKKRNTCWTKTTKAHFEKSYKVGCGFDS